MFDAFTDCIEGLQVLITLRYDALSVDASKKSSDDQVCPRNQDQIELFITGQVWSSCSSTTSPRAGLRLPAVER